MDAEKMVETRIDRGGPYIYVTRRYADRIEHGAIRKSDGRAIIYATTHIVGDSP